LAENSVFLETRTRRRTSSSGWRDASHI